jgi:hypothetical protein
MILWRGVPEDSDLERDPRGPEKEYLRPQRGKAEATERTI